MIQKILLGIALFLGAAGLFAPGAAQLLVGASTSSTQSIISAAGFVTTSGDLTVGDDVTVSGDSSFATTSTESFTQGGQVYSTTTTAADDSSGLSAATLASYNVIRFLGSATAAALTATVQASSSWTTLLPNPGDYRTWVIENGYTAAATTTTIAAGAGIDLQEPDGQNVVIGINNYAWMTCYREASTDIVCRIDETIPAD